jgi:hypothetical protein
MNKESIWLALICLLLAPIVANAQPPLHKSPINRPAPQTTGEGDKRLFEVITHVGYQDTIPSLLYALSDENLVVATTAAALLRRFPQSQQVVSALRTAIDDPRELLAVYAAQSLLKMGKTEWLQDAVDRLPKMQDRVAQIQLSGVLAKAGRTDGWNFVISPITEGQLIEVALENIEYFEGKTHKNGRRIVVADELASLVERSPAGSRPKILEKIKRLRSAIRR